MATEFDGCTLMRNLDYVILPTNGVNEKTVFANVIHRLPNCVTIERFENYGTVSLGYAVLDDIDFKIQYTNIAEWTRDMTILNRTKDEYLHSPDTIIEQKAQDLLDSFNITVANNVWTFSIDRLCNGIIIADNENAARENLHKAYDRIYSERIVDRSVIRPIQNDINYDVNTGVYETSRVTGSTNNKNDITQT